jgi:Fe-Mn family superoxide dismutase
MTQFSEISDQNIYPFILPDLPYKQNALEPYITFEAFDYHHKKHHQAYVTNLNNLLVDHELRGRSLEDIINIAPSNSLIFNNAAQVWNHTFYWHSMKPGGVSKPEALLYDKICQDFGSFEIFVEEFKKNGAGQFGSGWVWLVNAGGKLKIVKTSNAETPITQNQFPLFTCDVWEHAYYIDYRNRRPDYLSVFIDKLINWDFANENFINSQK